MRTLSNALVLTALFLRAEGAPAIPYDGPVWPKVTPAFVPDAESRSAPVPAQTRAFDVAVTSCVKTVDGFPRFFVNGEELALYWGRVNPSARKDKTPRPAALPFNVCTASAHLRELFSRKGEFRNDYLLKRGELYATSSCCNGAFHGAANFVNVKFAPNRAKGLHQSAQVSAWENSGFEASVSNAKINRHYRWNAFTFPADNDLVPKGWYGKFLNEIFAATGDWQTVTVDRAKNGKPTERMAVRFAALKDSEIDIDDVVVSPIGE